MVITTVTNVSNELNGMTLDASSTPTSTVVSGWITEAANEIELATGRLFSTTTFSSSYFDYDGSGKIILPYKPVNSITELKYEKNGLGATSESWTELTEGRTNDFILYTDEGWIDFFGNTRPTYGRQNVCISGNYGETTVPSIITKAASKMVAMRVIGGVVNSQSKDEGGTVSVGTITVTDPSTFGLDNRRQLQDDINNLLSTYGTLKTYSFNRLY